MKILATIFLAFVVLIAAYFCFVLSICAFSGGIPAGDRATYAFLDLIDIAIMVGAILLIAKLNRKK